MFNLNQAISEWRRQTAAGGIKAPDVLDELESHLRDAVAERMRSGLTGEQAFEAAAQQMGHGSVSENEFEKVGGAEQRTTTDPEGHPLFCSGWVFRASEHAQLFQGGDDGGSRNTGCFAVGLNHFFSVGPAAWCSISGRGRIKQFLLRARGRPWTSPVRSPARAPQLCRHRTFITGLTKLETGIIPNIMQKARCKPRSGQEGGSKHLSVASLLRSRLPTFLTLPRRESPPAAAQEAKALNRACVGSEHILLGLLRERLALLRVF